MTSLLFSSDWDELADNIKSGLSIFLGFPSCLHFLCTAITPHFVDTYDQVFQLALNYSAPTSAPSGGASVPAAVSDGKSASVDALAALLASASEVMTAE
jgi:hypothetical protein